MAISFSDVIVVQSVYVVDPSFYIVLMVFIKGSQVDVYEG